MSPEPTVNKEPDTFQAPFSTTIHDTRMGGLIATGTLQFFKQKLSFAWYNFTSKLKAPALLTTSVTRGIAGYPSSDVSPAISGRLMNTTASTKASLEVETLTHSWSSMSVNPPSNQYCSRTSPVILSMVLDVRFLSTQGTGVVGSAVAKAVGDAVGTSVGIAVGAAEGRGVGTDEGTAVGNAVGDTEGPEVGTHVGTSVGLAVGEAVGIDVGAAEGVTVGAEVGTHVGGEDGTVVGAAVGTTLGTTVGADVGTVVGSLLGSEVGEDEGNAVGEAEGMSVGDAVVLLHT
jgi:hypothetical protein